MQLLTSSILPVKRLLVLLTFCVLPMQNAFAQIAIEAESGILNGTSISTSTNGYSGYGYVTGLDTNGDSFTITVPIAEAGNYNITVTYDSPFGLKYQDIHINGVFLSTAAFPETDGFTDMELGAAMFNAGDNTLSIVSNWGWTDFDAFVFTPAALHDYNTVTVSLIDPNADQKTTDVYDFLRSQYGRKIIAGQTGYWDDLIAIAGKTPVLQAFDMSLYSPHNPWGADWLSWDDGTVQNAIDWYNSTGGTGIVSFQWHWFSPSGGKLRTSTFYSDFTDFDVSQAVIDGTDENIATLRDIDAIAFQLQRLEDAGVPVLWRPLHEAGGRWFWWGAQGAEACLALYDIMYDRLTNYHGLHNLIWVWSSPEEDWYPGNSKVDIIGYDSYPGPYTYGTQKLMFDRLFAIVSGTKLVAMTENGPIPDPNACIQEDAVWSYFSSWSDLVESQNSAEHIKEVYANELVMTMENHPYGGMTITPYLKINDSDWIQTNVATVCENESVTLSPTNSQPLEGTWNWTAPNGFTSEKRQISLTHITVNQAGTYTVTYTYEGTTFDQDFIITVNSGAACYRIVIEAESGILNGTSISTSTNGYSGSGYVTGLDTNGDSFTITVPIAEAGNYNITVTYDSPFGLKYQDIHINGVFLSTAAFPETDGFTDMELGAVMLNAGDNTLSIVSNWGWNDFDAFAFAPTSTR